MARADLVEELHDLGRIQRRIELAVEIDACRYATKCASASALPVLEERGEPGEPVRLGEVRARQLDARAADRPARRRVGQSPAIAAALRVAQDRARVDCAGLRAARSPAHERDERERARFTAP